MTVTAPAVTHTVAAAAGPSGVSGAGATSGRPPVTRTTTAAAPSPSVTPSATPSPTPTVTRETFDAVARDYVAGRKGLVGVVATDLATGHTVQHNPGQRCETASLVKLDVLLTLLLQRQDEGRELSSSDEELARSMITYSDNKATTTLWGRIGGDDGLREANERFGMTETEPGTSYRWGLTTTTAADQVRLVRNLVTDGPLHEPARRFALELLSQVSDDQDWGISAASPHDEAELKNGWLPLPDGWVVTSAGRVQAANGHELLMSVITCDGSSEQGSIETIEHLSALAAAALAG
ncbi:hypothetical protein ADJ73_00185 [Arsenicicoccus sp. oral taxon 190]|nr:hypothetical protein ADJ73_00185 [Arsenicicoccus sp. oral taxon 190]